MITYLDSGVLLHAWRNSPLSGAALTVMEDPARTFVTSQLVQLELLPKPAFEQRSTETAFYSAYFASASPSLTLDAELGEAALGLAKKYGLAAVDALHVAAAIRQNADELVTSEKPGKPMFRVRGIKVTSLHAATG